MLLLISIHVKFFWILCRDLALNLAIQINFVLNFHLRILFTALAVKWLYLLSQSVLDGKKLIRAYYVLIFA
jgi:hypothetical protein